MSIVVLFTACGDDDGPSGPQIWDGTEITFTKASEADWTLAANQDKISPKVTLTRQDRGPIYNYQWWMDTFGVDASEDDLTDDFWNNEPEGGEELKFTPAGGTNGLRWAILDDTGAEDTEAWDAFNMYGQLGNPANFYSFHNVASMIRYLNRDSKVIGVADDFNIELECEECDEPYLESSTSMPELVGKKLGVWLVEEDIYFTLTFTNWGAGDGGGVSYKRTTKK